MHMTTFLIFVMFAMDSQLTSIVEGITEVFFICVLLWIFLWSLCIRMWIYHSLNELMKYCIPACQITTVLMGAV